MTASMERDQPVDEASLERRVMSSDGCHVLDKLPDRIALLPGEDDLVLQYLATTLEALFRGEGAPAEASLKKKDVPMKSESFNPVQEAVAYLRTSSADPTRRDADLNNQRETMRAFCRANSVALVRTFVDEGSGNAGQPELNAMMDFVTTPDNAVSALVVWSPTRLTRNFHELKTIFRRLEEAGVELLVVDES